MPVIDLEVDDLDRRIIAALQVSARVAWRRLAAALGTSEVTIARRAQRLRAAGIVRVACVADPIRCGFGYPVLVRVRCAAASRRDTVRALVERPEIRYVCQLMGDFDLLAEVIVASRSDLARMLLEDLAATPGLLQTSTDTVLKTFKATYEWVRGVLDVDVRALLREEPPAQAGEVRVPLDPVDRGLYELLRDDGRRWFPELASALGISESTARRRVGALIAGNYIQPVALVDAAVLGYQVEAFVWLVVDLSRLEEVARTLAERREVRYVAAVSGPHQVVCEVILRTHEELYAFCTQVIGGLAGVRSTTVSVQLVTYKRAYSVVTPVGLAPAAPGGKAR